MVNKVDSDNKDRARESLKTTGFFRVKSLVIHRVGFKFLAKFLLKRAATCVEDLVFRPVRINIDTVFVVGCGHSGTTLIAAKIGRHDQVLAIGKESNIFVPYKSSLYMSSRILAEWADFAFNQNKTCVLEKTPKHLYYVDRINKVSPDHKMIAMIRNPLDTVASLYNRFKDLDLCVERWVNDNARLVRVMESRQVMVVRFEDLTTAPEKTLEEICQFVGLRFDPDILDIGVTAYHDNESTSSNMRIRSRQVSREITPNVGGWKKTLTEEQARYVLRRTKEVADRLGYHSSSEAL